MGSLAYFQHKHFIKHDVFFTSNKVISKLIEVTAINDENIRTGFRVMYSVQLCNFYVLIIMLMIVKLWCNVRDMRLSKRSINNNKVQINEHKNSNMFMFIIIYFTNVFKR